MKTRLLFLSCAMVFSQGIIADEVGKATARLERELQLIERIEPLVERPDLPRLYFLRSAVQTTLDSIEEKGLAHRQTFQEFQKLIVAFRFSVAYFKKVETAFTQTDIAELLRINEQIIEAHGFDDSPYTRITTGVYTQMNRLLTELQGLSLPEDLQIALADVRPLIGETLGVSEAKGGDRRTVYPVARDTYRAIQDLYPEFEKLTFSDDAFNVILEIQGLNEFYGEFAEFEGIRSSDD